MRSFFIIASLLVIVFLIIIPWGVHFGFTYENGFISAGSIEKDSWLLFTGSYLTFCGSIFVGLIANFIVMYENKLKNRKSLLMDKKHCIISPSGLKTFLDITDNINDNNKPIDYIWIKLINDGNRVIVIDNLNIVLKNKEKYPLNKAFFKNPIDADIEFPCRLEIEEAISMHIPIDYLCKIQENPIYKEMFSVTDYIVVVAEDTAGKKYELSIGKTFGYYFQLNQMPKL